MKRSYYFDILPIRPKPRRLESLTSYLTRLAEANSIRNLAVLSALFFESLNYKRHFVDLADYPPPTFGNLPKVTRLDVTKLLRMTFFHLGRKFGRTSVPLRKEHFLADSIASYLRYCPACLSEFPYYPLTWRFSKLLGCVRHKCRLLEYCGNCGNKLPLFSSPLRMSICPVCEYNLQSCHFNLLTTEELKAAHSSLIDLEFLLSPHAYEDDEALSKTMSRLISQTPPKALTAKIAASRIGIAPSQRRLIERGTVKRRGANLRIYFEYADMLGYSIHRLFSETATKLKKESALN